METGCQSVGSIHFSFAGTRGWDTTHIRGAGKHHERQLTAGSREYFLKNQGRISNQVHETLVVSRMLKSGGRTTPSQEHAEETPNHG
jgi:hypothetical protein